MIVFTLRCLALRAVFWSLRYAVLPCGLSYGLYVRRPADCLWVFTPCGLSLKFGGRYFFR